MYLEGRIRTRKWQAQDGTDRYSTEIVAEQMQMLGGRGGSMGGGGDEGGYSRGEPSERSAAAVVVAAARCRAVVRVAAAVVAVAAQAVRARRPAVGLMRWMTIFRSNPFAPHRNDAKNPAQRAGFFIGASARPLKRRQRALIA